MNPYFNQNFFGFFTTLFSRLLHFFPDKLASDEIQLAVLLGVAISTSLVGNFLIWRKMAMLANSLSHTILLGIVFAFVLSGVKDAHEVKIPLLLFSAVLMGLFTAFFTEFLTRGAKLQADASIGLVFTFLFALGVISVTLLTRNSHLGIEAVMGNADALTAEDIPLVYIILAFNLTLFLLFFKEYKITSFDPGLAKVLGISALFFNYLLMAQVSLTAIGAFRSVGVLMVLALLTAPPLTARLLTNRMKPLLLLSVLIGCAASLLGVALSRHLLTSHGIALSTAGLIVCLLALFFILASLWNSKKYILLSVLLFAQVDGNEAYHYLTEALAYLEEGSVNRKSIDWDSLKGEVYKQASNAFVPSDTYDAIKLAISLLGDNHSFFMAPDQVNYLETTEIDQEAKAVLIDNEIGYLLVPPFNSLSESAIREYALSLQQKIQELDGVSGWIVDLRGNTGGNMWPMVLGLWPLIKIETFGYFSDGSGEYYPWKFDGQSIKIHEFEIYSLHVPSYQLKASNPRIAVLVDHETCSSGEATAISFLGGDQTRVFGQKTGGYTSANEAIRLSDGAVIFLATTYLSDRLGRIYREGITPDQITEVGDSTLNEAIHWLRR